MMVVVMVDQQAAATVDHWVQVLVVVTADSKVASSAGVLVGVWVVWTVLWKVVGKDGWWELQTGF